MRKLAILFRKLTLALQEEGARLHTTVERLSEQNTDLCTT